MLVGLNVENAQNIEIRNLILGCWKPIDKNDVCRLRIFRGNAHAKPPDPRTMQNQCSFYEILTNQNVMYIIVTNILLYCKLSNCETILFIQKCTL